MNADEDPEVLPRFFFWTVLGCAGVVSQAAGETFDVGAFHAKLELPGNWRRIALIPNFGPDQFQLASKKGVAYATCTECDFLIDSEADHRRLLDHVFAALGASDLGVTDRRAFDYRVLQNAERGSIGYRQRVGKVETWHETSILSRDGLAYLFDVWMVGAREEDVALLSDAILDSFTFPVAGSVSAVTTERVEHRVALDGWSITLETRPCELNPRKPSGDSILSLVSRNSDVAAYFLPQRGVDSATAALEAALRATDAITSSEAPAPRRTILVDGREALSEVRPIASDPSSLIEFIEVPLGDGTFLDLRLQYPTPVECCSGVRRRLVESIRIGDPPALGLHPKVEPAKNLEPELAPWRSVLASSRHVLVLPAGFTDASRASSGDVVIATETNAFRVDAAFESATSLYEGRPVAKPRWVAAFSDRLILRTESPSALLEIAGTAESPAAFEAGQVLARRDEAVVLLRAASSPRDPIPGFLAAEEWEPIEVAVREQGRDERSIARLPRGSWIDATLAADDSVIVIGSLDNGDDGAVEPIRLRAVPIDASAPDSSGVDAVLGTWRAIVEIAASDRGVLVTGTPSDGVPGIHRVGLDGRRDLLLGGTEVVGVGESGGRLLFVAPWASDAVAYGSRHAYVAPIADLESLALACAPFTRGELERIAVAALADLAPAPALPSALLADPAGVERFLAAAEAHAQKSFGRALPVTPKEVDRLFAVSSRGDRISAAGTALVGALMARAFASAGAEWVGAREHRAGDAAREVAFPAQSDFALGIDPLAYAAFNLDADGRGWRAVAESISAFSGRRVFLGTDSESVTASVRGAARTGVFEAVDRGDAGAILPTLLELRANVGLRDSVYRRLVALGFAEALRDVAEPFATEGVPAFLDVHASLAARTALARDAAGAAALIPSLRAAIEEHGAIPALYVLLGLAYERSEIERGRELAKLCYREALAREPAELVKADAEAGLARIGG